MRAEPHLTGLLYALRPHGLFKPDPPWPVLFLFQVSTGFSCLHYNSGTDLFSGSENLFNARMWPVHEDYHCALEAGLTSAAAAGTGTSSGTSRVGCIRYLVCAAPVCSVVLPLSYRFLYTDRLIAALPICQCISTAACQMP